MDEKIEITEKAVRKSAEQESAFVDMLNQEVKELQENMEIVNLENELYNIQTYSYMEIYPCRQKQSNRIVAEHLIMKGYRKESDTAREIYKELFEKQTEVYNKYVFKNEDYDDLETNAIINFSDSLSYEFEKYFKEKYGVDLD